MSIFKPSVPASGEGKVLSFSGKVKRASPARSPSAVEFEGRRAWAAESHFVQTLRLERERAERSRQPFLLMLVEGAEVFGADGGPRFLAMTAPLRRAIRETDLCGWYEQNHILGVIFTEVDPAEVASTVEVLKAKVDAALRRFVRAQDVKRMEISFRLVPEMPEQDGRRALGDSAIHPDARKRRGAAPKPAMLTKRLVVP